MRETDRRFPLAPIRVDHLLACGHPDSAAITFKSRTLSYRELGRLVSRVANSLSGLGAGRGDRVVIFAEKRIETVVAMFAASAAGAVFVPVNPLFKPRQLAQVIADCGPRVLITTAERLPAVRQALDEGTSVAHVVVIGQSGDAPGRHGWQSWAWADLTASPAIPVPVADEVIDVDVAAILYTSGSTGGPKGVVLSHRNLIAGAESVASYLCHTPDDVVLAVLPLSFDAGLSQVTTTLIAGARVVLVNHLVPADVIALCAQHRVTGLTCVPPLWLQLAGPDWPADATASVRYFASTGGRMPRTTLARLRELFPAARPFLMYGLTEAFRSTYLDPAEVDRQPDSIGKAIPNTEILVVRPDGSPCAPGEHGELVHRGAQVALGYWNDPDRTAERFRLLPAGPGVTRAEIAVWSGDIVYRDDEGFLYYVSRADEMIKSSGYRISPTEIEDAAYATGLVAEAVAMGVADERLGQQVVLVVATPDGDDPGAELSRALARELPSYMLPHRVEVMPRLPRSLNGKFDRAELRRLFLRSDRAYGDRSHQTV
jgi:acyl-CoA ligase (AMP-forming) (exosortase A-associated)